MRFDVVSDEVLMGGRSSLTRSVVLAVAVLFGQLIVVVMV